MRNHALLVAAIMAMALFVGCPSAPDDAPPADGAPADGGAATDGDGEDHGHSHGDADKLTWSEEDIAHEGYEINLGLHGPHLHAGESAEVAVEIKKGEEPAADAKVFVTLLDDTGETELAAEQATVYEPSTPEEDAHYAQAEFDIPKDARRVTIRYRIEFTDAAEFTRDVLMAVE